jgi:hypothetical protein
VGDWSLTPERVIDLVGLILIPTYFWWNGRREKKNKTMLEQAVKQAHDEGAEAARGEQLRAATAALHARLSRYGARITRLEGDREWLLRKKLIPAGSQVGEEGRGAPNPYLHPELDPDPDEEA